MVALRTSVIVSESNEVEPQKNRSLWYAFVISLKNDFDLDIATHDQRCWLFFDQEGSKLEVLADLF